MYMVENVVKRHSYLVLTFGMLLCGLYTEFGLRPYRASS
jgi:hypothetical protein